MSGESDENIMAWKNLSRTYPSKRSGEHDVTTLSEITGHIKYKELVAIMGGSGCGKSTLMDILSGRKSLGNLGGELSLLGQKLDSVAGGGPILRDVAAYVPQSEHFFPTQTPEEAVSFVANLKLGKDERGDDIRRARVAHLLDLVGIPEEARKRPIGGTLAGGVVIRGLSGGERKRLALACAVAMKPSIVFLDEITSGLDSENAILVIELIKKICVNMNCAAVIVIHQPSYEVFSLFDRLILLTKGRCIFNNKLSKISNFYQTIDREVPEKHLLAGDILKISSAWKSIENVHDLNTNHELAQTSGHLLQDIAARKRPSVFLQFQTVLLRQLMNHYVRNLTNLFARVLIYAAIAVLVGCFFWKIGQTENGYLNFSDAEAAFGAGIFITQVFYLLPFSQISTFFFDKKVFASENPMGLYPTWMYAVSQFILETWVMVLCAFTKTAIVVPMLSLWNPAHSKIGCFVTFFSLFALNGLVGNGIVFLTSIVMWSQDLTFLIGSGSVTIFLVASGGFVPFPYMKNWIAWLQWISPIKYSFQAFTAALVGDTPTSAMLETLKLDTPSSVSANMGILIGFGVFWNCLVEAKRSSLVVMFWRSKVTTWQLFCRIKK